MGNSEMASVNRLPHVQSSTQRTHESAPSKKISTENQLRRSVLSCLLWEKEAYEDGEEIATRIARLASLCPSLIVYDLAMEARHVHGLRHVPLLLLLDLVRRKDPVITPGLKVKQAICNVIRRPDEMMELLALYWKFKKTDGKTPVKAKLSDRQLRDGLALCFYKFNEYQFGKYDRDTAVKLRDVMFLCHPKPRDEKEAVLFKKIAERNLDIPDTWEVALSSGKNKKETFERLLKDGNLGYLALLRNLRNMVDSGCDTRIVKEAILARKGSDLVFPFRYVAAARACPSLEREIDEALCSSVGNAEALTGRTVILVDVSGSMDRQLSARSDLTRMDAACTLASVLNADNLRVFSFSERTVEVPARRGMSGVDAIRTSQRHSSTRMAEAIQYVNRNIPHDRLIVISDEQAASKIPDPIVAKAYMINVASNRNGVGYGDWYHIDGFSEGVVRYISIIEKYIDNNR